MRVSPPVRLSLRDAADRLGVHYQTAYRWVREGRLPAVKVAGAYEVDPQSIADLIERRAVPTPPPARRVRDWRPFADRLHRLLLAGDEETARRLIEDLVASGPTLAEVCDRVLVPALIGIGTKWRNGEVSIAEEHRASSICERTVGMLSTLPPGRPRGVAVVCSPPTEEHTLPAGMATAVLRENHWRVHHLGTGVPVDDIVAMADTEHAALAVVTVTWPPAKAAADHLARLLRVPGRTVLVGQPGQTMAHLVELAASA